MNAKTLLLIFLSTTLCRLVSAQVQFCGEVLPREQPDVRQRWERSLSQQTALNQQLIRLKQRSAAVFPVIEPILERFAVPKDFKYLPLAESVGYSYSAEADERAGFWQFTPAVARRLGLMVAGRHRDQRYDLARSTVAACQYLWQLHRELGSWTLVAAAYHSGVPAIRRVREQFPQASVFSIAYHPETRSYLYPALVLKELMTQSDKYADRLDGQTQTALAVRNSYLEPTRRERELSDLLGKPGNTPPASAEASISRRVPVLTEDVQSGRPALTTTVAPAPMMAAVAPSRLLDSRSIEGDRLVEGQSVLFEVVRPQIINGIAVAVGDLIYAHVETINSASGRVFLRADRVMSARTQESIRLTLVAVEQPRQPGVPMPGRSGATVSSGWRLSWESL